MDEEPSLRHELPNIADGIAESYAREARTRHISATPLPSRVEVIRILEELRELLFPGYFGEQLLHEATVNYHIGKHLDSLLRRLSEQIYAIVRHECPRKVTPCSHCSQRAENGAMLFLRRIPELREILAEDVQAAYDGDPAAQSLDEVIFSYPGLEAVATYRIAHELHCLGVPLIPRMMTEYAHSRTGIDIHPGARIGRSFFIDHGTGVVIGETAVIGDNVKLYQGVTLGALSFPRDETGKLIRGRKRHPTVEDDVTIYSGATILGGETVIGKGAVIGGNVWLTSSVPPGTRVTIASPKLEFRERGKRSKAEPGGQ